VFEHFTVHRMGSAVQDRDVFETSLMGFGPGAAFELIPKVREDAIAGHGPAGVTAKARRIPLSIGENKDSIGLHT
jgi:hypothetical protein